MKRKLILSMLFICILLQAFGTLADDKAYRIEKIGGTINFPDDYYIIDKDSPDSSISMFGVDATVFRTYMIRENLAVIAMSSDLSMEIDVRIDVPEKPDKEFIKYKDDDLLALGQEISGNLGKLAPYGTTIDVVSTTIEKQPDASYISIYSIWESPNGVSHRIQKYTYKNGVFINFIFVSYGGAFSPSQYSVISNVISSTEYDPYVNPDWYKAPLAIAAVIIVIVILVRFSKQRSHSKTAKQANVSAGVTPILDNSSSEAEKTIDQKVQLDKKTQDTGKGKITTGIVLIAIQLFLLVGSLQMNGYPWNVNGFLQGPAWWYDLLMLIGDNILGIIGIILLVIGIKKKSTSN